jgi:hypothetical protein
MKAKEAALKVKTKTTIKEVEQMIPEYNNPLPRRAWIKTFLDNLPDGLKTKFSKLK